MDVNQIYFIGHNKYGQAGIGQKEHNKKYLKPKSIIFQKFIKQISCGNHHSAFLTIDGLVYSMGSNIHGTLGLGSSRNINYAFKPTLIQDLKDIDKIFSGSYHMCALKQGSLYTWGKGIDGQLGHGNAKNIFIPTKVQSLGSEVENVSCGLNHTLVTVNIDNQQFNGYAFGSGIYGQLGNGSTRNHNLPVNIKLKNIQFLSAGDNHSLFLVNNQIYGCGDNSYFQLGDSQSFKNKKFMLEPKKIKFENGKKFCLVDCQSLSTALTSEGVAYVWGGNAKIWPPIQLDQRKILDIKSISQKVSVLNNQSQIYTYSFRGQEFKGLEKQCILSNKSILDFDAADNHMMIIGDIVSQVQQNSQLQVLEVYENVSITSSKQSIKQNSFQNQNNNQYFWINNNQQKVKPLYITKNLKSGDSSQNASIFSDLEEKQESMRNCQAEQQKLKIEKKPIQNQFNQSSSIELQNGIPTLKSTDQITDRIQKVKKIKSQQNIEINELMLPNSKLQKLMQEMQLRTVHLKRRDNQDQIIRKNRKSFNESQLLKIGLSQKLQKTPSSHIKVEPQRFIISTTEFNNNNHLKQSPEINNFQENSSENQIEVEQEIDQQNLKLRQIDLNKRQNVFQVQNIKKKKQSQIKERSKSNIEAIFKQLLKKHHQNKQKNCIISEKQNNVSIKSKQNNRNASSPFYKQETKRSKYEQKQANSMQKLEYNKSSEFIQSKVKKIQEFQEDRMAVSKISAHSNISSKTNYKRNSQIFQISRSNRELRFELRKRDLKISQLQQNLSKKQMQLQLLLSKFEQFKFLHRLCPSSDENSTELNKINFMFIQKN